MKNNFLKVASLMMLTLPLASCGSTTHTHTASTTWSSNVTQHWHECTAKDNYFFDQAEHTFGAPVVTAATCTVDGKSVETCTVCSYEKVTVIPATGHNMSTDYKHDANQHWTYCTNKNCTYTEKYDHSFDYDEVIVSEPTCTVDGAKRVYCVCGAYEDVTIPATGHDFSSSWSYDDTEHYHVCLNSGCNAVSDEGEHAFAYKYNATQHWEACSVCGYEGDKENHTIEQLHDEEYHWNGCEECGYVDGEKTAHNFVNGVCADCGYAFEYDSLEDVIKTGATGDTFTVVGEVVGIYGANPHQGIFIANGDYAIQLYKYGAKDIAVGDIVEATGDYSWYASNRTTQLNVTSVKKLTAAPANYFTEPTAYTFDASTWDTITSSATGSDNVYTNREVTVTGKVKSYTNDFVGTSDTTLVVTVGEGDATKDVSVYFKKSSVDSEVLASYKGLGIGQTITVTGVVASYKGATQIAAPAACVAAPFTLDSVDFDLTSVTEKTYNVGDTIDVSGVKVTAHYSDGRVVDVKDFTTTADKVDMDTEGYKAVKFSYYNFHKFAIIEVKEVPVTVTGITVDTTDFDKVQFMIGDTVDTSTLVVKRVLDDGTSQVVPASKYSTDAMRVDTTTVGVKTFTVTYFHSSGTFTADVSVTINNTTINAKSFTATDSSKSGYAAFNGSHKLGCYTGVSSNVMLNTSYGSPALSVVQFKASSGSITIDNIKTTKVVFTLLSTYELTKWVVVTFDGTTYNPTDEVLAAARTNKVDTGSVYNSSYPSYLYSFTYEITVNAQEEGKLVIKNASSSAAYLSSIVIY